MTNPPDPADSSMLKVDFSELGTPSSNDSETKLYRPQNRPSMAVICLCEDGAESGMTRHIFGDHFVIGRTEGDLTIEHDTSISSQHAELVRRSDGAKYHWYLKDLGSTNGTFVRVGKARLEHNQELLLGGYRFRFDAGGLAGQPADAPPGTRKWEAPSPENVESLLPALVMLVQPEEQRFPLHGDTCWIGRAKQRCKVHVDDPMLSPQHAKLTADRQGRWEIVNNDSLNGVWIRINQVNLGSRAQFQIGEQRFTVRVP